MDSNAILGHISISCDLLLDQLHVFEVVFVQLVCVGGRVVALVPERRVLSHMSRFEWLRLRRLANIYNSPGEVLFLSRL